MTSCRDEVECASTGYGITLRAASVVKVDLLRRFADGESGKGDPGFAAVTSREETSRCTHGTSNSVETTLVTLLRILETPHDQVWWIPRQSAGCEGMSEV